MILCLQQGDDGQALSVTDRVLLFALAAQARTILLPPALHYLPHLGFWTLVSCSISDTAHSPEGPLQIIAGVSSRAVQPEPESVAEPIPSVKSDSLPARALPERSWRALPSLIRNSHAACPESLTRLPP